MNIGGDDARQSRLYNAGDNKLGYRIEESDIVVVGLAGRKGCGKSAVADMLKSAGYHEVAFGTPLKDICRISHGLSERQLYGDLKETPDVRHDGLTPREILQVVGTDLFRAKFGGGIWVSVAERNVRASRRRYVVVSDVRFPEEVRMVRDTFGGKVYFIERDNHEPSGVGDAHVSEGLQFDADTMTKLWNRGTSLDELREEVRKTIGV